MSKILVTCPGCLARFEVSEKYAGKKGPCPKCKKEIVVPDKKQEVVIHAPADGTPKDSKGVPVFTPIKRAEFKVGKWTWIGVASGVIAVLAITFGVRASMPTAPTLLLVLGSILLAPPVVMFAYTFLHDDELEGYTGQEYWVRTAICSLFFASTWLVYVLLAYYFENKSLAEVDTTQMAIYMAIMIGIGTAVSLGSFELETPQAVAHYLAYFTVTFALCWIMRVELAEPLASPKSLQQSPTSGEMTPPAESPNSIQESVP